MRSVRQLRLDFGRDGSIQEQPAGAGTPPSDGGSLGRRQPVLNPRDDDRNGNDGASGLSLQRDPSRMNAGPVTHILVRRFLETQMRTACAAEDRGTIDIVV
jgi:hypothetical protein